MKVKKSIVNVHDNVVVFGADGLVGSHIIKAAAILPFNIIPVTREVCDVTDPDAVFNFFKDNQLSLASVVNCTMDNSNDKEKLHAVNVEAVQNLATMCKHTSSRLYHISSDYVFSDSFAPEGLFLENLIPGVVGNNTSLMSEYATTKLAGEDIVKNSWNTHIIRTSWVYGVNKSGKKKGSHKGFTSHVIESLLNGVPVVIEDNSVSIPTNATLLATFILASIKSWNDHHLNFRNIKHGSDMFYGIPALNAIDHCVNGCIPVSRFNWAVSIAQYLNSYEFTLEDMNSSYDIHVEKDYVNLISLDKGTLDIPNYTPLGISQYNLDALYAAMPTKHNNKDSCLDDIIREVIDKKKAISHSTI